MGSDNKKFWHYAFETELKKDLKIRFALVLLLVNVFLMVLFTVSLYQRISDRLYVSAEQALASSLDREWRHLQFHEGDVSSFDE